MKKFDLLWPLAVIAIVFGITRQAFVEFATNHLYLSGFIKFGLLAPLGELLVIRLTKGDWKLSTGFVFKTIIWGLFGMSIALSFKLFELGTVAILEKGFVFGQGNKIITAFFIATFMNLSFGPVMMGAHKVTDKLIDLKYEAKAKSSKTKATVIDAVNAVDWNGFISFVVFKTVPFFWIPAHTIVFLLPGEYRLVVAALLSIALGILLSLANKKPKTAK